MVFIYTLKIHENELVTNREHCVHMYIENIWKWVTNRDERGQQLRWSENNNNSDNSNESNNSATTASTTTTTLIIIIIIVTI